MDAQINDEPDLDVLRATSNEWNILLIKHQTKIRII